MADAKFTVVASQIDDNVLYVRQGDGSTSHQDVATVIVFGKEGHQDANPEVLKLVRALLLKEGS